jgi:hypothetical protein
MEGRRGQGEEMLPECGVVWLEASESATQSVTGVGGVSSMMLKEPARDCGSHTPDQGVQDCCGGGGAQGRGRCARGGVNSGPTGDAAKKACSGLDGTDGLDGPSHMLMVPV